MSKKNIKNKIDYSLYTEIIDNAKELSRNKFLRKKGKNKDKKKTKYDVWD